MNITFFPCRTSRISKIGRYGTLFFYPSVGILSLVAMFFLVSGGIFRKCYTDRQIIVQLLVVIGTMLISIFLFYMSGKCYRMETRSIAIDSNGFVIRVKTDRRYAWESIGGIAVIAYAANANKDYYQTQICIFLEPIGDTALRKLHNSYLYGAFHCDKYVLMDCDPYTLNMLETCIDWTIPDIRSKQLNL